MTAVNTDYGITHNCRVILFHLNGHRNKSILFVKVPADVVKTAKYKPDETV